MSLNGLDNPLVKEAHAAAIAEPGGWFLLKYATRDEIDVYCRGTGGIVEVRNAIAKYEDVSPLYGVLKYRRRNIILKFLPEECSRLVKARATVHFNAICEQLSPYDTTFEITAAKELKDTKLSAACSLHAASGSTSSSTSSLRRRRLMEIAEEEEEEERSRKRQSTVQEERPGTFTDNEPLRTSTEPPVVLDKEQITAPKELNFASTAERQSFEGVRPTSPAKSDYHVRDGRLSLQGTRPDLYSYSSYPYGKPKVRLGPRPSLDAGQKPNAAANFRPVAALPAGFKLASKGSKKGRSETRDATTTERQTIEHKTSDLPTFNAAVPIPEIPHESSSSSTLPPRPNTSSGASIKSMTSFAAARENRMTPEKARLMKAMKLREQKKKMSLMPLDTAVVPELAALKELSPGGPTEDKSRDLEVEASHKDTQHAIPPTDSAISVDLPTPLTVNTEANTEDTFMDSHPPSPTVASSEVGKSTKASSVSESTDETILPIKATNDEATDDTLSKKLPISKSNVTPSSSDKATATSPETVPKGDETHDARSIEIKDSAPSTKESEQIPVTRQPTSPKQEHQDIKQTIEIDDATQASSNIRTQNVLISKDEDDASPRSPYGIPISRFSSNENKSPSTPNLKSKFSLQDLKIPSEPFPALPALATPPAAVAIPELRSVEESPRSVTPSSEPTKAIPIRSARRPLSPIFTDVVKDAPESELADPLLDDALMDELQAATFEEAHSMNLSKSPITPVFPSTSPKRPQTVGGSKTPPSRTFSNPLRGPLLTPGDVSQSSARSVSAGGAAFLHNITRQPSNSGLMGKKSVGNSITQRIKALEQLQTKTSNEDLRPKTPAPSTSFISVRKGVREPSKSPSFAERANSVLRKTPTPNRSREPSPDRVGGLKPRGRSGSMASRLSMFETGAQAPRGRPEAVQVTARIVRNPQQAFPKRPSSKDPGDYNAADLRQSQIVVDHSTPTPEPELEPETEKAPSPLPDPVKLAIPEVAKETLLERRQSRDGRSSMSEDEEMKKRRSSFSMVKDFIKDRRASITNKSTDNLVVLSPAPTTSKSVNSRPPSTHQTTGSSFVRRLSISSRRSSFNKDRELSTPPVMSPLLAADGFVDDAEKGSNTDKSKNRATRFMRRLSNSLGSGLGSGRKNSTPTISPTLREEDEAVTRTSAGTTRNPSQPALAAYMGDVNVQFPDNLLWKRRSLCLDTQGFLILSAIQGATANPAEKSGLKRYHLSDFRLPYIPDVDMQELPNSICLDFVEGSGLQIACEDRHGQKHVLDSLQEAHQNHSSFGQ